MKYDDASVRQLINFISNNPDSDDIFDVEEIITRKIETSNIQETIPLLTSLDRDQNIVGIRILAEAVIDITEIYDYIEQLFQRDNLILNRICADLLIDREVFNQAIIVRMSQFIDCDDKPLRKYARVWLIGRPIDELKQFQDLSPDLSTNSKKLTELIIGLKSKKIKFLDFMNFVQEIDEIAFKQYSRFAKSRFWKHRSLLET